MTAWQRLVALNPFGTGSAWNRLNTVPAVVHSGPVVVYGELTAEGEADIEAFLGIDLVIDAKVEPELTAVLEPDKTKTAEIDIT